MRPDFSPVGAEHMHCGRIGVTPARRLLACEPGEDRLAGACYADIDVGDLAARLDQADAPRQQGVAVVGKLQVFRTDAELDGHAFRAAGRRVAEMLIDRIVQPEGPPHRKLWQAELVVGTTTGPAPSAGNGP